MVLEQSSLISNSIFYGSAFIFRHHFKMFQLRASPEMFSAVGEKTISWRVYSGMFLLLTGGTEIVVGESLTLYTLCRPELNLSQQNGVLLTSTFWFGIFAARIPLILV